MRKIYKYLKKYYDSAVSIKPGFIPDNWKTSSDKYIERLSLSEFIAFYTLNIDRKIQGEKLDLNPIGMKLYLDYITSIYVEWIIPYYKILDRIKYIILNNNIEEYKKIRFTFLYIINKYLEKYGE